MKKSVLGILVLLLLTGILGGCQNEGNEEQSHTAQGMDAVVRMDYVTAMEQFDLALLSGEEAEQVYRGMGLCYMGQGEYAKAVTAFRNALSYGGMFPGDLEYDINYYMAICYYKMGSYDEAIAVYDAIVELLPKEQEAYFLRGTMKLYLDDVEGAVADFDRATELDRNNYGLYLDAYECMLQHGYEDQAQSYLDVVLVADSSDISDYDKGRLCYFQGEYAQACNYLERARSDGKADAEMISLLGECYKLEGQYEYAAVVYGGYVETNPDPEIYNKMGLCYVEQGDYASALAAFQAGSAILENNTCMQTLLLNEIACYEYLYDFASAEEKLAAYLAIYPSTPELEKEYAFLTTR